MSGLVQYSSAGVSFAVANATGILARLLQGRPGLRDADQLFRELVGPPRQRQ